MKNNFYSQLGLILLVGIVQACSVSKPQATMKDYPLRQLTYSIVDPTIEQVVLASQSNSLLKNGQHYSPQRLGRERDRLYRLIRTKVYENFDKNFIYFNVDTSLVANEYLVETVIGNNK